MPSERIQVLIIEDDPTDALLIQETLSRDRRASYLITNARLFSAGLDLIHRQSFDIILLDLGLPDSHGLDAFNSIHRHAPHIPVVILSGLDDEDVAIQAVQAGAQDYLVKGNLAWQIIGRTIRYAIERQQSQAQARASEARYRALIEHSADAIILIGPDGRLRFEGSQSEAILGFPVTQTDVNGGFEFLHPDDQPRAFALYEQILGNPQTPVCGLFRARHADGGWRWLEATASNLLNEPGVESIVVNYRDITQRKQAEDDLRLARFSLDHTSEVVFWINSDGRIVDANQFAENALGYTRSELLNMTIFEINRQLDPDSWAAGWLFHRQEPVQVVEGIHTTRDGRNIPVEVTICHLNYGDRELHCTFARDISARRQAAEALAHSERKYRELFQNAPIGIFRLQTSAGRLIDINAKACQILGYEPGQLMDMDIAQLLGNSEMLVRTEQLIEQHRRLTDVETILTTSQGLKHCLISAVWYASEDILEGTIQDITERKLAEEALQKRTKELSQLLEAGRELSNTLDMKNIYQVLKRFIERTVPCDMLIASSYSLEDGLIRCEYLFDENGEVDVSQFPPISLEPPGQGTQSLVIRSGESLLMPDYERQRSTASSRYYFKENGSLIDKVEEDAPRSRSAIMVPLFAGNLVVGVLQIFSYALYAHNEDHLRYVEALAFRVSAALANAALFKRLQTELAERKAAEDRVRQMNSELERRVQERTSDLSRANAELEQSSRAKDEFLANMSHELRTPLNAILTLTESLEEGIYEPVTPRQLKPLRTIAESGHHLLNLINDILDLSKIAAGKLELRKDWMETAAICESSLRMVRQMAVKKNHKVTTLIDPSVTHVYADQRCLKQMLVNLLSNAVKFTPPGGSIGLEVTGDYQQGRVLLSVWDSGIGIAAEDYQRLFEPFVQLDTGLARQFGGTGLGLPLVYRMAELHDGSISLSSEVGQGSRFTLSLPWPEQPQPAPDLTPLARPVTGKRSALLVDQSLATTEQITRYLHELEMKVAVVDGGLAVIDRAVVIQPDVILMDVLQPDISGWKLLHDLKQDQRTSAIPVIVISVVDEPLRALSMGAVDALLKPVERSRLIEALSKALPAPARAPAPEAAGLSHSGLILLAEDHAPNQVMYTDYLTSKGYQVVLASNGVEAIQRAKENKPDLIMMDIQMPGMDGLEAIRRIRQELALQQVPIIALTALAMPGDRERCLAIGANEYLSKPVSLKNLLQLVSSFINK